MLVEVTAAGLCLSDWFLMDLPDLARAGLVRVHVERYGLDDAPEAYRRLHEGRALGRAVVVP